MGVGSVPGDEDLDRRAEPAGPGDDPVGDLELALLEEHHEAPCRQLVLDEDRGRERHSVAVPEPLEHQVARQVDDVLLPRGLHPPALQPGRHLAGAELLQPGQVDDVRGLGDGAVADQRRRADQHVGRRQQELDVDPAPMAVAVADGDVDPARDELDELGRRVQHQLDLGMLLTELREPRHQPALREGRGRGHQHRAARVGPGQLVDGAADVREGAVERSRKPGPLPGERRAPARVVEQLHPERLLERAHPLADRRVADVEGGARLREAAGLGQRREGTQRPEGRHRAPVHS
jgi:hypothetical protein